MTGIRHSCIIAALLLLIIGSSWASSPQVWDFGADPVAGAQNMLSEEEICSWFGNAVAGTQSLYLRSFTASDSVNLRYYSHGAKNHRLRTINMSLTHTDEKSLKDASGQVYRGMIYANTDSDPAIYIEQYFEQGDTVEYVLASNGAPEQYRFYLADSSYYATCEFRGPRAEHHRFVCPKSGHYRISGVNEKLVIARITRYPLQHELTKKELCALRKMSRHPLRNVVERAKYRSEFPDTCANLRPIPYRDTLWVSPEKLHRGSDPVCSFSSFTSINAALNEVRRMKDRQPGQRVVLMIAPGNYEEMLRIDMDDITLKNASPTPSIMTKNRGVEIDDNAVRITGYYGGGYNYYSMNAHNVYDARTLRANIRHKECANINKGGSHSTYWNAVVLVSGTRFIAEDIIFENSYNQYVSKKELTDVVVPAAGKPIRPREYGSTDVQHREYRERAAALAFATDSVSESLLRRCSVISRQDAFYGDQGAKVRVEGGTLMGAVDYIFGGMTLVCIGTRLAMLVSEAANDVCYLTASQTRQSDRGYLFYNCHVTSAIPLVEMADSVPAKPGLFGRPWAASGETVFVNTTIDCTEDGKPLITPAGWSDSLTGKGAARTYEYNTRYQGHEADYTQRIPWATVLPSPILPDGTIIDADTWVTKHFAL